MLNNVSAGVAPYKDTNPVPLPLESWSHAGDGSDLATQPAGLETLPTSLEAADAGQPKFWRTARLRLSLFWRTFLLILLLIACSVWAWSQASHLLAGLVSMLGAIGIARLINRPMQQLSFAASKVNDGEFDSSILNEHAGTEEIRAVNAGFNRMAEQLSKVEQDRAVMLAGISHDLRTPLARLRLETEMSVKDDDARAYMVADLEQLDAIIDKFLDYARPFDERLLIPVSLNSVVAQCVVLAQQQDGLDFRLDMPTEFTVRGDEVELTRVIGNLIENARRYGKTPNTQTTQIDIAARERYGRITLKLRDHGAGVSEEALKQLTQPFYRADEARTAATGAGLGLAIVEKTVQRMGGVMSLANSSSGGLAITLKLNSVASNPNS